MKKIRDVSKFTSGTPQFRITQANTSASMAYKCYAQAEMENDLAGMKVTSEETKIIRTNDDLKTVACEGDILFSLISGKAAIVSRAHDGYLYTQNYVKLLIDEQIDKKYMVYLLNENSFIKRQWHTNLQGSIILKYTLNQLKKIELPNMPPYEKQQIIGDIYLKQLKIKALKERVAETEKELALERIKIIG